MTTKRRFAIMIASLFVVGIFAVPATNAQVAAPQTDFTFSFGNMPAAPLTPLALHTFKIDYEFIFTAPAQNVFGAQGSASVEFTFNCPQTVTISGSKTDIIPIPPSPSGTAVTVERDLSFQLTVSRDARALDPLSCVVTSSVTTANSQSVPAPNDVTKDFTVQADYFSLLNAQTALKLIEGGPQKQIPFELTITNFGNGQTKINFEVTEKPGGKWQGLAPDLLLLDEKGGSQESSVVTFTVVTPFKNGWNNEEGGFTILLKPEYSFDNKKTGSEVAITLVARVRGVYVPSLEPMIMVGAVIGSAFLARMMREDEE